MPAEEVAVCKPLVWDTAFFGFPVARVLEQRLTTERAELVDAWCREKGIRCLYFLADAHDASTTLIAEEGGFRSVDVRITFERSALSQTDRDTSAPGTATVIRPARPEDIPALRDIARQSHRGTRFFSDPNFTPASARALYETWIQVSCQGYADRVLVADRGGMVAGYISCHLEDGRTGKIGLLGVSRQAQKQGVGISLVRKSLEWFDQQGVEKVIVATQEKNQAAQRLYESCGFILRSCETWYHKWYVPESHG